MEIEIRCPTTNFPRGKLFAKLEVKDGVPIVSKNILEVACYDCRKDTPGAKLVLHRFSAHSGELLETIVLKHR